MSRLRVVLCGNPNVGKSTVFNALTGMKQHTGNWAGKTVESACGQVRADERMWELVDLPGAYSLLNGSPEENVAADYLTFEPLDAVIVVCDATCLERNLNLAMQVAQACPRAVLCVNMLDEACKRGMCLNLDALEQLLGVPVVGVTARRRQGLDALKRRVNLLAENPLRQRKPVLPRYPQEVEEALSRLAPWLASAISAVQEVGTARFAALRALTGAPEVLRSLVAHAAPEAAEALACAIREERAALERAGYSSERLVAALIAEGYRAAGEACRAAVRKPPACARDLRQLRLDKALSSKRFGIPLMLGMLAVILYITILGANVPSEWLSAGFARLEDWLNGVLRDASAPEWLRGLLMDGVFRVTAWVISVMLPPMAIFFPLFTLLEDLGVLPRVAFNLDKCFQRCRACGKQALCMAMGLGCNAVGVMGCRIIQSPRERLIAILTNALVPCNGRFPTLIALITMFFVFTDGALAPLMSALALTGLIALSVTVTLLCSRLLSATVLKGVPSSFTLELPPYRCPKVGEVVARSLVDRTLFVLGRAVAVAAPAGLCVWLLANARVGGVALLQYAANWLEPAGRFLGMDGAILLGFILGFPANEIVLPIVLMIYLSQGTLVDTQGLAMLRELLVANGWTGWTAGCVALFSLFHWPCSTTTITVYRETHSARWTLLAVALPTAVGCVLCALVAAVGRLMG